MVADCSTGKRKRSQSDGSDVCCKLKQTGVFDFFVVPDNAVRDYGILGDGAFYMGQTLRIREGPRKGYLCRVLTLRRSEYNNQVLTVTCELLGEVHGNNSASCTRTSCGQRINQSCNAFINEQSELGENNVSGVNNFGSRGRNWTWGSRSWGSSDRDCSVGRSSYRGGFHGRDNSDRGGFGGMGRVNDWTRWGGQSGCTSDRGGLPRRDNFYRGRFGGSCGDRNWNASKSFDERWSSSRGVRNWNASKSIDERWSSSAIQSCADGNENGVENFGKRHRDNWGDNRGGRESFYRGDFCSRGGIGDRDFRCRGDSDRVSFGDRGCSYSGGFGRRACWNSCNDCGGEKYSKWGKLTNNDSGGWKGDWNSSNSTDEKSLDLGKQNSNDRWQGHDATKSWQPPITFCCGQGSGSNQSTLGNEASGDHHEKSSSWARRARTDRQEFTSSDAGNSWNEECSSTWIPAIASGASQGSGWNQSSHS